MIDPSKRGERISSCTKNTAFMAQILFLFPIMPGRRLALLENAHISVVSFFVPNSPNHANTGLQKGVCPLRRVFAWLGLFGDIGWTSFFKRPSIRQFDMRIHPPEQPRRRILLWTVRQTVFHTHQLLEFSEKRWAGVSSCAEFAASPMLNPRTLRP